MIVTDLGHWIEVTGKPRDGVRGRLLAYARPVGGQWVVATLADPARRPVYGHAAALAVLRAVAHG